MFLKGALVSIWKAYKWKDGTQLVNRKADHGETRLTLLPSTAAVEDVGQCAAHWYRTL